MIGTVIFLVQRKVRENRGRTGRQGKDRKTEEGLA